MRNLAISSDYIQDGREIGDLVPFLVGNIAGKSRAGTCS